MADSSNPPDASAIQDQAYICASNTNVSNFVSVKLSGYNNYRVWKKQMLCLMKIHKMCGLSDDGPMSMPMNYDCLLQGWILGSVSEDVLNIVVDLDSAKKVWNQLKRCFDSTKSSQQGTAPTKAGIKTERKDNDVVSPEITHDDKHANSAEAKDEEATITETKGTETDDQYTMDEFLYFKAITGRDIDRAEIVAAYEETTQTEPKAPDSATTTATIDPKLKIKEMLLKAIADRNWYDLGYTLISSKDAITQQINTDGNTALHIAVGIGRNDFISNVLRHKNYVCDLTSIKNNDGSTFLHVAAIVGNTDAAKILIREDVRLLDALDKNQKTPLHIAYENMNLDTIAYLLEVVENQETKTKGTDIPGVDRKSKKSAEGNNNGKDKKTDDSLLPRVEIGVNLLVNAISAKEFGKAKGRAMDKDAG